MTASPAPSANRMMISSARACGTDVGNTAVSPVTMPHHSTPRVNTLRGPKRAARTPAGTWKPA